MVHQNSQLNEISSHFFLCPLREAASTQQYSLQMYAQLQSLGGLYCRRLIYIFEWAQASVFPVYQRWWYNLIWRWGSLRITDTSSIYVSLATVPHMKDALNICFLLWPLWFSNLILCLYILSKSLQFGIFYRLSRQTLFRNVMRFTQ